MSKPDASNDIQFRTLHIRIKESETCLRCVKKQCTIVCPAGVYRWDGIEMKIHVEWPACLESGACLVACNEFNNIEMSYPDAGTGVKYNYG
jgi:ferredoxin like protein